MSNEDNEKAGAAIIIKDIVGDKYTLVVKANKIDKASIGAMLVDIAISLMADSPTDEHPESYCMISFNVDGSMTVHPNEKYIEAAKFIAGKVKEAFVEDVETKQQHLH